MLQHVEECFLEIRRLIDLQQETKGFTELQRLKIASMLLFMAGELMSKQPTEVRQHYGDLLTVSRNMVAHANVADVFIIDIETKGVQRYLEDCVKSYNNCKMQATLGVPSNPGEVNAQGKIPQRHPAGLNYIRTVKIYSQALKDNLPLARTEMGMDRQLLVLFECLQLAELLRIKKSPVEISAENKNKLIQIRYAIAHFARYIESSPLLSDIVNQLFLSMAEDFKDVQLTEIELAVTQAEQALSAELSAKLKQVTNSFYFLQDEVDPSADNWTEKELAQKIERLKERARKLDRGFKASTL